jgi:hypothetical protein
MSDVLRQHAEQQFAHELEALKAVDDRPKPQNWNLSPMGSKSAPNTSGIGALSKLRWRRWLQTVLCCCWGCPARLNHG